MKKLYQLKTLLPFLTILFVESFTGFAMILDTSTAAKCYTPDNYGTVNEEVVLIQRAGGFVDAGMCLYKTPSFLITNPNDPSKYLCAKVQKCIYTGLITRPEEPAGEFMYIYADPGWNPGYESALSTATGGSMPFGDKAYLTLAECQAANPNRIIGVSTVGGLPWISRWADMANCQSALLGRSPGFTTALTDGGCSFAPPSSGKQSILVQGGAGLASIDKSYRCSCATTSRGRPPYYDIYVESGNGTLNTIYSGLSTDAAYDTAKTNCFNSNTNRFYSNTLEQCFSSLDACKTATSTARDLECTETQKNNLFLLLPPSIKTEFTAAQEDAKRTQFLTCARSGKTDTQCINEAFGAGPTSTTYSNSNFYRCKCQPNLTGILCTAGALTSYSCAEICSLAPTGFSTTALTQKVVISSPLTFIKVLSNFLFYAALVIFIINFLIAGLQYVRSGGQPDALKIAQARITNSIGGLIFILLVGALLNYLVSRLTSFGF